MKVVLALRDDALFRSQSSRSSSPNQALSTRLQRGGVMTFPAVPPLIGLSYEANLLLQHKHMTVVEIFL